MPRTSKSAFTLIEILVSLAIVAVLSTVVVVTLNPAELVKQARDSNRISDLNTINTALGTFSADVVGGSVGVSSTVYVSLPSNNSDCSDLGLPTLTGGWVYKCTTSENLAKIDGTGWIPANLQRISFGNPLEKLPIDPKNSTSTGLYYTFVTTGSWWELTAVLESEKYGPRMVVDGGASPNAFEQGTMLTLTPTEALDRGVPPDLTVPSIASISPTSTTAGDPGFTLTVNGENFTSSSVVKWGGSNKTTTFISAAQLTASILAADIAATGTIAVTVYDPVKGTSGSSNFAIDERTQFIAGGWTTDSTSGGSQSYGASIAEVNGEFYVVLGYSTGFQKYSPATKSWTNLTSLPSGSNSGAAIVKYDNNTLYALLGASASFYKYTISTGLWSAMTNTPASVGYGGALTYPGTGDYIYALGVHGSNYFWRYSVSNNSWDQSGSSQNYGASIAEVNGEFYIIRGWSTGFQKYSPSTRTWTNLTSLPSGSNSGAAIVKYDNNTLYALLGASASFYKYTISTGLWSAMTNTPASVGYGGALTYPGTGDYIYALGGAGSNYFWRYSVTGNSWGSPISAPATIDHGVSLTSVGSDTLYAFRGGGTTTFWKYTISTGTWETKAAALSTVGSGGSLTSDGTNVFATRGLGTKTVWKYTPASNSWTALSDAPSGIGTGEPYPKGGIAYSSALGKIYAISGSSNGVCGSIFEYNINSNAWPSPACAPATIDHGVSLTSVGSDTLYAFRGGGTTTFWKYTISTGTWETKAAALSTVGSGGSLTSDGTNVFATRGLGTKTVWKYTPASNSWTALSDAPSGIGTEEPYPRGGLSYSATINAIFAIPGYATAIYKNSP